MSLNDILLTLGAMLVGFIGLALITVNALIRIEEKVDKMIKKEDEKNAQD